MTYEQNVRAILESNFSESKGEIVDIAVRNIVALSENKGDLISRQAVLNAIQKLNIPEDMCVFEIISHIEVAIATLPSIENKGEWIPVTERLPEEKQAVLVWCPEYKNIYCAYCANGNWWIFGAFSQINPNAVIAWQPLPEPYKGGVNK